MLNLFQHLLRFRNKFGMTLLLLIILQTKQTQAQIITTVAGNGTQGYSGDGGQATAAEIFLPEGIVADAIGNFYIVDVNNNVIRKVNTSGIITTIAGTYSLGATYSGDGGQATSAEIDPFGVVKDTVGNIYIYIADLVNNRIRKVNTLGIISTIAGNGFGSPYSGGFSGDGGNATAAELYYPSGVAVNADGSLYIIDGDNHRIRKVTNASTAGVKTFNTQHSTLQISPNPATNSLRVSFAGNSEGSTLVMCDMLGNMVKQTSFNTQQLTLNINDVEAGVYFITVSGGSIVSTQKVVVSK